MDNSSIVRFKDLTVVDPVLRGRLLDAVAAVLDSGQLLMGPQVARLEDRIARYCGRKFCVGVSSGTDALYLALRALDIGVGDEVICPAMSWVATANAIAMTGATPVFIDVRRDQNLDPDLIEPAVTSRTKAVLPVHFTGRLADMAAIATVARRHGLKIVEDAAQAFGARENGVLAGGFGDVAAFSLNPMKVLVGYGENGAVLTDDESLRDRLTALRYLGAVDKERCDFIALNAKMDEIQAAMLQVSLDILEPQLVRRREIAAYYSERLSDVVGCPPPPDERTVAFDYQIVAEDRAALIDHLARAGIETRVKHPILMPDQPVYRHLPTADLPVARHLVARILSLPLHDKLERVQLDQVIAAIRAFYQGPAR